MKRCVHIVILGNVQGVFYRINAERKAEELDLTGWVRNMIDGGVEILAEGEEINLKKIVNWCRNGSDNAIVSEIKVKWCEYEEKFDKFRILV